MVTMDKDGKKKERNGQGRSKDGERVRMDTVKGNRQVYTGQGHEHSWRKGQEEKEVKERNIGGENDKRGCKGKKKKRRRRRKRKKKKKKKKKTMVDEEKQDQKDESYCIVSYRNGEPNKKNQKKGKKERGKKR